MLTAESVKKVARSPGADAVGIGSIDRWQGAPTQMDPRQIKEKFRRRKPWTVDWSTEAEYAADVEFPGQAGKTPDKAD